MLFRIKNICVERKKMIQYPDDKTKKHHWRT